MSTSSKHKVVPHETHVVNLNQHSKGLYIYSYDLMIIFNDLEMATQDYLRKLLNYST
jgi:hypothetical protein